VVFAGHRTDVPEILQALDIFVLPSNWEGLPNAVLEAMAAGLPVVATRVGGVPEVVVEGQTGILVPPRDPNALADALLTLLRDPNLRRRMGQAGRQRVQEYFSVDQMVSKTETLYEQLLSEKGLI
jgi:glycosyltransferase involved in cell wall biosynthesis